MLNPIRDDRLAALPGIDHGFFTREGGVSDGLYASLNVGAGSSDAKEKVRENRARVARHLGADHLVTLYQVHSDIAVATRAPFAPGAQPKADALVTDRPGLAIGALSADCGPVLFADAKAGVIAAAHSGWKGLAAGILDATVAKMESLGARREAIVAVLGPTISVDAYEVGDDFRAAVTAADPAFAVHLHPGKAQDKFQFDLPAAILGRLTRLGVDASWIGACTYADEARFFSYRRTTHRSEPDYGRHVAAITLVA